MTFCCFYNTIATQRQAAQDAAFRVAALAFVDIYYYRSNIMKTCTMCHQSKPVSDYYRRYGRWPNTAACKPCCRKRAREIYEVKHKLKNKPPIKKITSTDCYRKRVYGVSRDMFNKIKKDQGFVCKICGLPEEKIKLCVDHCHTCNQVRGLLCSRCNSGIGLLKDNIDILASAISYLQNSCIHL